MLIGIPRAMLLIAGSVLLSSPPLQGWGSEPLVWNQDVVAATAEAESSEKDMLLLFTGRGWCSPCMALEAKVLSQTPFTDAVREDFVLVEFDLPADDSGRDPKLVAHVREMQNKYLVNVFPTIILTDSTARPHAYLGGYRDSPQLIDQIQTARQAKRSRDDQFRLANEAQGVERISHLHRGIEAIAPWLGNWEDKQDDPVLVWYGDEIDQIKTFTGTLPDEISATYRERTEASRSVQRERAVVGKINAYLAARDFAGGLAYIEQRLETATDVSFIQELQLNRISMLERDQQEEAADAAIQKLLDWEDLALPVRETLLNRQAYRLFAKGKTAEALAHFDRRIKTAEKGSDLHVRLLSSKAQMVLGRIPPEQSIAIWEAYRSKLAARSYAWNEASILLARQYQQTGQHTQTIKLLQQAQDDKEDAWVSIDLIRSLKATGEQKAADELLIKVREEQARLAASDRPADQDDAKDLAERLKTLDVPPQ